MILKLLEAKKCAQSYETIDTITHTCTLKLLNILAWETWGEEHRCIKQPPFFLIEEKNVHT